MSLAPVAPAAHKRPVGLEAIIIYKLLKAGAEVLLGTAAVFLVARGAEAGAATLAEIVLEHFAGGWAIEVATFIVVLATSGHVKFVAVAAFADAILSAVEGLALQAGRWWAPWLVVIATGALLPLELWALWHRPKWGRVLILLANLAVATYLLVIVMREQRTRKAAHGVAALTPPVDRRAGGP
jgi:uncharacterized membrane protein (DUF2068 family)